MIKITFAPMQEVKIKIVNRSSHPLPEYATADSAGMDLRANIPEVITLGSLERRLVPTGLYIELPTGFEAQIRPRSGLAIRSGLTLLNTPGTVDADYRGEIGVIMVNLSPEAQEVHPGERIAQMVISPYTRAVWEEAEVLSDTERGSGGFGHTGRH
jgi:dUTP pyrophosphatase